MLRFSTILHPTDFSVLSEGALEAAHALARDHNAKLVLLAVAEPPAPSAYPMHEMSGLTESMASDMEAQTRRDLAVIAARITDIPVESEVRLGVPGDVIVATAKEREVDLIVMGTHGRTGLSRLLMGSTAENVMRHASCPVLTMRPGPNQNLGSDVNMSLVTSAQPKGAFE